MIGYEWAPQEHAVHYVAIPVGRTPHSSRAPWNLVIERDSLVRLRSLLDLVRHVHKIKFSREAEEDLHGSGTKSWGKSNLYISLHLSLSVWFLSDFFLLFNFSTMSLVRPSPSSVSVSGQGSGSFWCSFTSSWLLNSVLHLWHGKMRWCRYKWALQIIS